MKTMYCQVIPCPREREYEVEVNGVSRDLCKPHTDILIRLQAAYGSFPAKVVCSFTKSEGVAPDEMRHSDDIDTQLPPPHTTAFLTTFCHEKDHYYSDEQLRGNPCAKCFDEKEWCPICGPYFEKIIDEEERAQ